MIRQLLIAALVGLALAAPSDKVDGQLRSVLSTQGRANAVVSFVEDTKPVLDRINSMKFASRGAKISTMKAQLEELQASSQKNALRLLSSRSVNFHSFWINNKIIIENATPELVSAIAALPEVAEVREELVLSIFDPIVASNNSNSTIKAESWGIEKIEAKEAWALPGANNGAGVIVATIDTGVRHTHEALRNNMRSSYVWFDPYSGIDTPTDGEGHGTHVLGTMVGAGGIGVAPGAQWITCRGCRGGGSCTELAVLSCGQWITCPTLYDGSSPNCDMAPHICSNSWGGRQCNVFYSAIVEAWHAAGIIPVFAAGDSGSQCRTVMSPGDYPNVIAVSATRPDDIMHYTSSRGPSICGNLKPDLSAPGLLVNSAWNTGDDVYNTWTGSSMAAPHVSGTVALLLSQNPNLSYEQVKDLLQDNADRDLSLAGTCENLPPGVFPNNDYGYGRINARRSLAAAINGRKLK